MDLFEILDFQITSHRSRITAVFFGLWALGFGLSPLCTLHSALFFSVAPSHSRQVAHSGVSPDFSVLIPVTHRTVAGDAHVPPGVALVVISGTEVA